MVQQISLKNYNTLDELQRDLRKVSNQVVDTLKEISSYKDVFSVANVVLSAVIRGKPVATDTPTQTKKTLNTLKMHKDFKSLKDLHDHHDTISNMVNILTHDMRNLGPSRDRTLKSATELLKTVKTQIDNTHEAISNIAKTNSSPEFKNLVNKVKRELDEKLEGKYEGSELTMQVGPVDDATQYSAYIIYHHLTNDEGYVWPMYYIVLSDLVKDKNTHDYYANVFTTYKLPGFKLGLKFTNLETALRAIEESMYIDNFADIIEPRRVPVPAGKIEFNHSMVQSTHVEDNKINIILKSGPKGVNNNNIQQVLADLLVQLRNLVFKFHPRNKDNIKYKMFKTGTSWNIQFAFTVPDEYTGKSLRNLYNMPELQKLLNLTDEEVTVVQHALQNMRTS